MIGTIGAYTSMMKMQYQWNIKKDTGVYTQKSYWNEDPILSQLDDLKEQNTKGSRMTAIFNKMNSGKKLTSEELEYLLSEDPAAYQKAKEIQMEQEGYEKALKNCKTKEDVQRLKSTHMGVTMARVNSIANNPNIPEGKKMELLMHENAKAGAVCQAEREFVESGQYDRLPSEAEQKEAMEREQEKIEEKLSGADEDRTEDFEQAVQEDEGRETEQAVQENGSRETEQYRPGVESLRSEHAAIKAGGHVEEKNGGNDLRDVKQLFDDGTANEGYRPMEIKGRAVYRKMAMDIPDREQNETVRRKV